MKNDKAKAAEKETKEKNRLLSFASSRGEGDLFGQTLRTVVVLVGACILFVGSLSTAAVLITNKALGSSTTSASSTSSEGSGAKDTKSNGGSARSAGRPSENETDGKPQSGAPKKPISI